MCMRMGGLRIRNTIDILEPRYSVNERTAKKKSRNILFASVFFFGIENRSERECSRLNTEYARRFVIGTSENTYLWRHIVWRVFHQNKRLPPPPHHYQHHHHHQRPLFAWPIIPDRKKEKKLIRYFPLKCVLSCIRPDKKRQHRKNKQTHLVWKKW